MTRNKLMPVVTISLLIGAMLMHLYHYHVQPLTRMNRLREESYQWQGKYAEALEEINSLKDENHVFNLNHATIQAQNKRTKVWAEMDRIIPDALDVEEGE